MVDPAFLLVVEEEDNEDEERFLDMDDRRTCEVEIRSPLKDGRMQDEETQKDEGGDDDDEEEEEDEGMKDLVETEAPDTVELAIAIAIAKVSQQERRRR